MNAPVFLHKYSPDEPRDDHGRWTDGGGGAGAGNAPAPGGGHGGGMQLVSPNVGENVSFTQAVSAITSQRQIEVMQAAARTDEIMGLTATSHSAIGAWADGAENSIAVTVRGQPTWEQLEASAAMKGMLADQKAVIPFKVDAAGKDAMYQFAAKGDMNEVHNTLTKLGLEYHTLQPSGSSTRVWIFDQGTQLQAQVVKAGEHYGTRVEFDKGTGEFLGSWDSRDEGRAAYERVIERTLGPDQRARWDGLYRDWRTSHPVLHAIGRLAQKAALLIAKAVSGEVTVKATSVNSAGMSNARALVAAGKINRSGVWDFSADDGDKLLGPNGNDWANYGKWFLATHADQPADTKAHYGYPFGKNGVVYVAGLKAAEARATQQGATSIATACDSMLATIYPHGKSLPALLQRPSVVYLDE